MYLGRTRYGTDGHHSLIRWGFVVHNCIDGFSRMITFLRCSTNNWADTLMSAFQRADVFQCNSLVCLLVLEAIMVAGI